MLKKIEKIKGLGKYKNYISRGPVDLRKLTIIYAENGMGKTTLTQIFRSLTDQNDDLLFKKRNIDTNVEDIELQLIDGNNIYYTFNKKGWKKNLENIVVFDTFFVNENVYSGFDFTNEHKRELHQFVLGKESILITQEIQKLKDESTNESQKLKELENEIRKEAAFTGDISNFLSLKNLDNINDILEKEKQDLEKANQQEIINKLTTINKLPDIRIPFFDLKYRELLEKTPKKIMTNFIKYAEEHIEKLSLDGMEDSIGWIDKGFKHLKNQDSLCPFCNQPLEGIKNLLSGYNDYFNLEYDNLRDDLDDYNNKLNSINPEILQERLKNDLEGINSQIKNWFTYINEFKEFQEIELTFISSFESFKSEFNSKLINPNYIFDFSVFENIISELTKDNAKILELNNIIDEYNKKIINLKATLLKKEVIQTRINELNMIKDRFKARTVELCDSYLEKEKSIKQIKKDNSKKQDELKNKSVDFLENYAKSVNKYLKTFNTEFTLDGTKDSGYKGRADKPAIEYKLLYRGQELSFEENSDSVSVKHALSEGDKSTIAFAFFLSKIDIDENKSNLIIIFDDPISSLDTNRRNVTINEILNISNSVNQVIILSHNDQFVYEVEKRYRGRSENIQNLKIAYNKQIDSSEIQTFDIELEFQNEYFKGYRDLLNFSKNPIDERGNNEVIIGKIRTVLETHLKFKFFEHIKTRNGTFGKLIDELESTNVKFRDITKSDVINKLRELNDISWRPHHGKGDPGDTSSSHEISLSFTEIESYVIQTLEMIDLRL